MHVILPDGKQLELQQGATALDAAKAIGPRLAQDALAATSNGKLVDLLSPLPDGANITLITKKNPADAAPLFRHSLGHVMSMAVGEFYRGKGYAPDAIKRGVGPYIENGWYQDFDLPEPLKEEDLPEIEKIMRDIIGRNLEFSRTELPRAEALKKVAHDPYKVELINDLPENEPLTFYQQGDYVDLCRGPHFPNTGKLPTSFKLMSTSGAYWRGNEKNPILQRIYGVAFASQKELDEYLHLLEEAKRRDHRRIGKEMELFFNSEVVGPGLPLWLPGGATIRRELERYIVDKELEDGYQHVYTPVLAKSELYKISGHWDHYNEDMFPVMKLDDQEELVLRPMNCPHHIQVYAYKPHSYRELPIKIAEMGMMHRYEQSGQLTGLSRVRAMTLNDAHIFCRPDQIQREFKAVVKMIQDAYEVLGFKDYSYRLSLRDPDDAEKYFQNDEMWNHAEEELRQALKDMNLEFYESPGDAAFYGPKLDVQVRSALGKDETISTVQLDFLLPQKFDLEYVAEDGSRQRPVMIHRGVISTAERMTAFLIEQYAGNFPLWLAPRQVMIIPIADRHNDYAWELRDELHKAGLRAEVDDSSNRMQAKVRTAEISRIPVMLIVGDKEQEAREVATRERTPDGHKERKGVKFDDLRAELLERYRNRK